MSSLPPLSWGRSNQWERMYCIMHPERSGTDMRKPNFPSWAERRGAVAETQLQQLTGRLWTVHNKQKSFWQLFHMCMQIIYPFGKNCRPGIFKAPETHGFIPNHQKTCLYIAELHYQNSSLQISASNLSCFFQSIQLYGHWKRWINPVLYSFLFLTIKNSNATITNATFT